MVVVVVLQATTNSHKAEQGSVLRGSFWSLLIPTTQGRQGRAGFFYGEGFARLLISNELQIKVLCGRYGVC